MDEQQVAIPTAVGPPPKQEAEPSLAHLLPKERRDAFFQTVRSAWQVAEIKMRRLPFPVAITEQVYRRFLEGGIPGMERIGKGKNLLPSYVGSWAGGSAFDLIRRMYEERDRGP